MRALAGPEEHRRTTGEQARRRPSASASLHLARATGMASFRVRLDTGTESDAAWTVIEFATDAKAAAVKDLIYDATDLPVGTAFYLQKVPRLPRVIADPHADLKGDWIVKLRTGVAGACSCQPSSLQQQGARRAPQRGGAHARAAVGGTVAPPWRL